MPASATMHQVICTLTDGGGEERGCGPKGVEREGSMGGMTTHTRSTGPIMHEHTPDHKHACATAKAPVVGLFVCGLDVCIMYGSIHHV